jgi:sugar-specific transcriptional regulator TrmB
VLVFLEVSFLVEKTDLPGETVKFYAKHPEQLSLLLAKQKSALSEAEENLSKTLPEMRSIFQLSTTKPGIKFYEGKEGIIKIYEDLLAQKSHIDSFEDKGEMSLFIPEYAKEFITKRIKNKVYNRVIAPSTNQININSQAELRETRFLPVSQFPFRMDIKIAGNEVSLISFQKENPVGILIENKEIADNFHILFDLVWKFLEPKTGLKSEKILV